MSMRTYITHGYGLNQTELDKIDQTKLVEYAKEHTPELCAGLSDGEISEKIENYNSCYCDEGPFCYLAETISKETGINFDYITGDYDEAIMLCAGFPWQTTNAEKDLTQEKINNILSSCLDSLASQPLNYDYHEIESFG